MTRVQLVSKLASRLDVTKKRGQPLFGRVSGFYHGKEPAK